ncbi:hypothetical protein [Celeribacter indicus]|uniref:Uncharacterized protein n=1 Tax=Celeribacter indicus TaxID=1208324 RepID=A0A0B5DZ67_9RHOB|nr:hypothetical protein [Celeribacter indicus]AJE46021.1 hypothetical protein P73_1306 [Celeribacter indicus]SDX33012.1 hypothetical protein SAMN05443573_12222 [Celeribacter indicus]
MTVLLLALALALLALPLLWGPLPRTGRIAMSGFDGKGVLAGFVVTFAVAALTSPLLGFGFLVAVLIHETGSALACRIAGQEIARIRLVPLPRLARPRSDRGFDHALEESFVALYAPALALVPMTLAFGLFAVLAPVLPMTANLLRATAIMIGAFNFVMLLPFRPLCGGRVTEAVSDAFWPRLGLAAKLFMTAAFAIAALRDHSLAMGMLAAAGLQSLFHRRRPAQDRLSANEALLVMASYAFVLTTHFLGGYWLIKGLI